MSSMKKKKNQYNSAQSWLDFTYSSQATRRLTKNVQKAAVVTAYSRPKLCIVLIMFCISSVVQTGKFFLALNSGSYFL